jgi:hypothetical protein
MRPYVPHTTVFDYQSPILEILIGLIPLAGGVAGEMQDRSSIGFDLSQCLAGSDKTQTDPKTHPKLKTHEVLTRKTQLF